MLQPLKLTPPSPKHNRRPIFQTLFRQRQLLYMSVPMLLYILLFNYAPLWGWLTAFMDYKPARPLMDNTWVGFANFSWLFGREEFLMAIRNTFAMSIINLTFNTIAAITLAVLLNEIRLISFKRTIQTVTYLPHFLSWVIVVGMAQTMFATDGIVNQVLISLGLIKNPAFFLGEGRYFWWVVAFINVWKEVGWNSIIYLAAMAAIDPALYEAAQIDGAGRLRKIRHITLPGIKSTFVVLLIMNIGSLISGMTDGSFDVPYLMGQNILIDWSQTIDIFVLKYGISKGQYGRATAAGIFKSLVSISLLLSANLIARKLDEETLL
jgi:putative aldouronate transport system permease protein